jgi:hypothetical protein
MTDRCESAMNFQLPLSQGNSLPVEELFKYISAPYSYESGWRSRYSDWIRAERSRGRSSSPGRVENFLFSTSSRPVLGPT